MTLVAADAVARHNPEVLLSHRHVDHEGGIPTEDGTLMDESGLC